MATYKVIQDIEAEDKLLGPLSMRQFIYAIIVFAIGGLAFLAAKINLLLVVPFLPFMGFFGLLAAPFGRDQSSEVWLLAKIRFMFKPRRRIWDQSGLKELVTITVPKKIEKHLTDGLDQTQVRSRLNALASTLDSRGWAIKNVAANTFTPPVFAMSQGQAGSDRLVAASTLPQAVVNDETQVTDDILDEYNNPTAQKLNTLINQSEQARRQNLIATMQTASVAQATPVATGVPIPAAASPAPVPQSNLWFTAQNAAAPTQAVPVPAQAAPVSTVSGADEQQLLEHLHQDKAAADAANSHIKRIPTAAELAAAQAKQAADERAAKVRAEELKQLARNDDLNIATIARQADKDSNEPQTLDDGEVVISLR